MNALEIKGQILNMLAEVHNREDLEKIRVYVARFLSSKFEKSSPSAGTEGGYFEDTPTSAVESAPNDGLNASEEYMK